MPDNRQTTRHAPNPERFTMTDELSLASIDELVSELVGRATFGGMVIYSEQNVTTQAVGAGTGVLIRISDAVPQSLALELLRKAVKVLGSQEPGP